MGDDHDWLCISPGLYDSLCQCSYCKTTHMTQMQAKKAAYLVEKGGKIAQPRIEVVMPDGSTVRIDSHGRVYWQ